MRTLLFSILGAAVLVSIAGAQSPTPIVIPAMTPVVRTQTPAKKDGEPSSMQNLLKALQAMKAANEELLKQQAVTLQKLDEMEKAANEIRIYTKRG
jgi:hypothetical protein